MAADAIVVTPSNEGWRASMKLDRIGRGQDNLPVDLPTLAGSGKHPLLRKARLCVISAYGKLSRDARRGLKSRSAGVTLETATSGVTGRYDNGLEASQMVATGQLLRSARFTWAQSGTGGHGVLTQILTPTTSSSSVICGPALSSPPSAWAPG